MKKIKFAILMVTCMLANADVAISSVTQINSNGELKVTKPGLLDYVNDNRESRALLFSTVESETKILTNTCMTLRSKLKVSKGTINVYHVLNEETATTLDSLIDNNGDLSNLRLLTAIVGKYASQKEFDDAGDNNSCTSVLKWTNDRPDVQSACMNITTLGDCLIDLYNRNYDIEERASSSSFKYYNGQRYDDGEDALELLR